ncbi:amino acid/polyamine/organocation transporter, APC superfamily [Chitinophaga costaii]|uniref:Amino acid/polyamine/organocation transporter, APC superfamily n=2 Tax=Chitinophaga costaii TaxID=1335309 RepID=A0A1C4G0F0_9BACT|nr:amino acid/polyamine/organocation transporter, APC superfamily [Chitinophaga costaii]
MLRPAQLAAVIFLTVSGGPYGLEPLLLYGGNNAILLLLVVPLLWDLPTIFTVMELNSMMPLNGGYYQWVKQGLGLRWAFYEGWWTWLYTFVDLAIYPVLFVEYASFFFPAIAAYKLPICWAIIWGGAWLNIRGIVPVGKAAVVLGVVVVLPFAILAGMALWHSPVGHLWQLPRPAGGMSLSAIGMGLYTVMWNFLGWDNATTYAEEVDHPVRSYLWSLGAAFLLIFVLYFVTVLVALHAGVDVVTLQEVGFPVLGTVIGGWWLGALLSLGGMASALGLFSAVMLSVSRMPKAMADDRLLPPVLSREHRRYETPWISILCCAVVVSLLVIWTFEDLLIIDITLYGTALFLEFIALIILRIKAPQWERPFRIPLGIPGLCIMTLLPLIVFGVAFSGALMAGQNNQPLLFSVIALISGEVVWQGIRRIHHPANKI